jgi:hypothetical protein
VITSTTGHTTTHPATDISELMSSPSDAFATWEDKDVVDRIIDLIVNKRRRGVRADHPQPAVRTGYRWLKTIATIAPEKLRCGNRFM